MNFIFALAFAFFFVLYWVKINDFYPPSGTV